MTNEELLELFQDTGYTEKQLITMRSYREIKHTLHYTAWTLSLTANMLYGNAASDDMGAKLELNNIKSLLRQCDEACDKLDKLEKDIAEL